MEPHVSNRVPRATTGATGRIDGTTFTRRTVLTEGLAKYDRTAGQTVVHRFIEAQGSVGSMSRFLAKLFENFDGIKSVSLYVAKNDKLEHTITLQKGDSGRIYPDANTAYTLCDKEDICSRAYDEFGVIINFKGTEYRFDLNPENTGFAQREVRDSEGMVGAFPLYSGSSRKKHGILMITGDDIKINGSNAEGATVVQESADALVSIARLVSYIIDNGYDTLTGLPREKQFAIAMDEALDAFYSKDRNCAFIRFDIDHLKDINDLDGHEAGDMALQRFSEAVATSLRLEAREGMSSDIIFRLGGGADEFIAVLPDVDARTAAVIADRVRRDVAHQTIVTCSCGVSDLRTILGDGQVNVDKAVKLVKEVTDKAAYAAKEHGRNTVFSIRREGAELVTVHFTQ